MLWLRRNRYQYDLLRCQISNEIIYPGQFYYVDDKDGLIVKADVYRDIKEKEKEAKWDYSALNNAQNEREYKELMKEATRQMLSSTLLDRKVAGKYDATPENPMLKDVYDYKDGGNM